MDDRAVMLLDLAEALIEKYGTDTAIRMLNETVERVQRGDERPAIVILAEREDHLRRFLEASQRMGYRAAAQLEAEVRLLEASDPPVTNEDGWAAVLERRA